MDKSNGKVRGVTLRAASAPALRAPRAHRGCRAFRESQSGCTPRRPIPVPTRRPPARLLQTHAIEQYYQDFSQVTDKQVLDIIQRRIKK